MRTGILFLLSLTFTTSIFAQDQVMMKCKKNYEQFVYFNTLKFYCVLPKETGMTVFKKMESINNQCTSVYGTKALQERQTEIYLKAQKQSESHTVCEQFFNLYKDR